MDWKPVMLTCLLSQQNTQTYKHLPKDILKAMPAFAVTAGNNGFGLLTHQALLTDTIAVPKETKVTTDHK